MRNLATIMLAAVMLPLFAAAPPSAVEPAPTKVADEPSITEADAPPNYVSNLILRKAQIDLGAMARKEAAAMALYARAAAARMSSTCYFIRQANPDLKKPKDKPELLPLADSGEVPISSNNVDCLTASNVRWAR